MNTKDLILRLIRRRRSIASSDVIKRTGITRQTAAQHFRELIAAKKIIKMGSTRNAAYTLRSNKIARQLSRPLRFLAERRIKGLQEDKVFDELHLKLNLSRQLSAPGLQISRYAFTEMLNNAIEHSGSEKVKIICGFKDQFFDFQIQDRGIGVFESVRRKFKLKDHHEAAEHLLKGKQTTDPKHHTGEGIFFTSKISDLFKLDNAKLRLIVENMKDQDVFIVDTHKNTKGTSVSFRIKKRTRKTLKALFDAYSNADYEFDKTEISVHLSERKDEYVSRSEAKRLLFRLEKFKKVVLDFSDVRGIGQGFADEIFRVFQLAHPDIEIVAINTAASVARMIRRARA